MWAALLPILLPIAESAAVGVFGWAVATWGPHLGITPVQAAALAAAAAKLLPTNTTKAVEAKAAAAI